jgi:hypothetical protein
MILISASVELGSQSLLVHIVPWAEGAEVQVSQKPGDQNQIQEKGSGKNVAFQCSENCAKQKQTCEQNALKQEDKKISQIGSKENNEWSRNCQLTYYGCLDKCK